MVLAALNVVRHGGVDLPPASAMSTATEKRGIVNRGEVGRKPELSDGTLAGLSLMKMWSLDGQ